MSSKRKSSEEPLDESEQKYNTAMAKIASDKRRSIIIFVLALAALISGIVLLALANGNLTMQIFGIILLLAGVLYAGGTLFPGFMGWVF